MTTLGRALAVLGLGLIVVGLVWQTYNLVGAEGWKNLKALLATDPAFATICAGALLTLLSLTFL
jgi:hypothetical protein